MSSSALEILQSMAGFVVATSPDPLHVRLAVIDPAYVSSSFPGTLPKVTFEGETTMSTKRYPVLSGYLPVASDRVVMVPIGTTYLIIGATDTDASGKFGGNVTISGALTVGSITTPTWTSVSFQNSWANWGSGYDTCQYTKHADGTVRLKGTANGGSKTGDTLFTLPAGYRPGAYQLFPNVANGAFGTIEIASDGQVIRYAGTATYVALDGITFIAAG